MNIIKIQNLIVTPTQKKGYIKWIKKYFNYYFNVVK